MGAAIPGRFSAVNFDVPGGASLGSFSDRLATKNRWKEQLAWRERVRQDKLAEAVIDNAREDKRNEALNKLTEARLARANFGLKSDKYNMDQKKKDQAAKEVLLQSLGSMDPVARTTQETIDNTVPLTPEEIMAEKSGLRTSVQNTPDVYQDPRLKAIEEQLTGMAGNVPTEPEPASLPNRIGDSVAESMENPLRQKMNDVYKFFAGGNNGPIEMMPESETQKKQEEFDTFNKKRDLLGKKYEDTYNNIVNQYVNDNMVREARTQEKVDVPKDSKNFETELLKEIESNMDLSNMSKKEAAIVRGRLKNSDVYKKMISGQKDFIKNYNDRVSKAKTERDKTNAGIRERARKAETAAEKEMATRKEKAAYAILNNALKTAQNNYNEDKNADKLLRAQAKAQAEYESAKR